MDRRAFLKGAGVVAAALTLETGHASDEGESPLSGKEDALLAAPCGLYCGICDEHASGGCHGCKCKCGKCSGVGHSEICRISKCIRGKKLDSCAKCGDLPCTALIQFATDPIWKSHASCIENLRRRSKIGVPAWLREQEAFWSDEQELRKWQLLGEECGRKWQEFKKQNGSNAR